MRRVVVTGLGLFTSIGGNVKESWDNLISCKSGIKKITKFDTSDLSCKIAGHISEDSNDEFYIDLLNILDYPKEVFLATMKRKNKPHLVESP